MKNFFRIFSYIHIPKDKLALYLFYTLLSTLFSILSIGMLSPFMNIIFNVDTRQAVSQSNAIGHLREYFQQMIDRHDKIYGLSVVCVVIIIASVMKNLFLYLSYYISTPVRNKILSNFRTQLYDKILRLPISYYSEQKKGDIMSRMMADVGEIQGSIILAMEGLIKDPLTICSFLVYMVALSPSLSLFLLVLLPITALIIGRVSKRLKKQSGAYSRALGENLSHVEETLGGIKIIKAFTAEKRMMKKFRQGDQKMFSILNSITLRRDLASPLTEVMAITVLCIILYVGGRLVFSNSGLSSGDLISFILAFAMMINPAKNLSSTVSNIRRGMGAIERVEEILHTPVEIEEKPDAVSLPGFDDKIEFKNVTFAYNGKTALKNINLVIEKGKTIALVGSSGAGKSTLAELIPRFHDVTSGEILIDGLNIKEYTLDSLRNKMSFVTQEAILFNDTIAANISLGKSEASEEEITQASKIANAHYFIVHKEEAYNTNIGDRGMKLSGGEKQRVTIARAVLQNPPILILDEATSSLDTESERLVQDAIINLMQDRTSIVIAHRLSTIRNANEIIVLQKGEIIERGTHENLIRQNGFYKRLVDMQEIK